MYLGPLEPELLHLRVAARRNPADNLLRDPDADVEMDDGEKQPVPDPLFCGACSPSPFDARLRGGTRDFPLDLEDVLSDFGDGPRARRRPEAELLLRQRSCVRFECGMSRAELVELRA